MGWLTSLFVDKSNVKKIVDAGIKAGDSIFYTEEEKANSMHLVRDWYIRLLDSMRPHNVAMRLLAVGVFMMWGLHLVLSTGLYVFGFFYCGPESASCLAGKAAGALDAQMDRHINDHFYTIIMFYFGAAGLNSVVSTAKGNKT